MGQNVMVCSYMLLLLFRIILSSQNTITTSHLLFHNFFTDIDECTPNNNDCHSRATCTNPVGSYLCKCNEGYNGTGKNCTGM